MFSFRRVRHALITFAIASALLGRYRVATASGAAEAGTIPTRTSPFDAVEPTPSMHATGLVGGVFSFGRTIGADIGSQAAYPFRLARGNPKRFLLGSAGILALVATDRATRDALVSPGFVSDHGMAAPATWLSNSVNPDKAIPLVLGVGVVGVFGSARERETSLMLTEALITSSVWTGSIKYLTGRERPRETSEISSDWTGPAASFTTEPVAGRGLRSFPSGHSSGTWAIATVLAHQYPQGKIVPALAYATAVAMSYSRMVVGAHWLSDVVVGGLIGYGCANQVVSAHSGRAGATRDHDAGGWHVYLESDQNERNVGFSYGF